MKAWFAVLVFCIAQIVSTIDRGMLALVIDPVRADLRISEIQMALLQGLAFAIFYATIGLPMGLLADRVSRKLLLIVGIFVWSLSTIGGGLAHSFGEMFASRLFIGIGEAVLAPCAVTMISDLFPMRARGRPMAVYVYGTLIAFGLGALLTGYILEWVPRGAFDSIAPLRGLAPWRVAFILFGIAGFVVAALMLGLRDPPRQAISGLSVLQANTFATTLRHFRSRLAVFLPLYGSLALFALGASVASNWGAALLTRGFGFTQAAAGKSLGLAQLLWATLGMIVAAVLVDRVARRGGSRGKIKLAAMLSIVAIPSALAVLAGSGMLAVFLLAELIFVIAIFGTTMLSVIPEVTPVGVRGLAVSLYAFVMTLIGGTIGPLAVAFLTEHVYRNPAAVGSSMAIVGTIAFVSAAAMSLLAERALRHEPVGAAAHAT